MQLTAEPEAGLVDAPVTWSVDAVPPGTSVTLTLEGADADGRTWRSEAAYPVDEGGRLVIENPDGPWSSMVSTDAGVVPVAFTAPDAVWVCTATARAGSGSATATVRRLYQSGVTRSELTGARWRMRLYRPDGSGDGQPRVLVVPGSTGLAAMAPTAALLASHGYPAAVLAYMQEPGLPTSMQGIPVEVVGEALRALRDHDAVDEDRIAVWAASVGTGLALSALAAPDAPRVRGVVVVSPTDVVWQALGDAGPPPKASSLTQDGADLPWLPIKGERLLGQVLRNAVARRLPGGPRSTALRLFDAYDQGRQDDAAVAAAAIPVERIDAPLLVVAGAADAMWPSTTMADAIAARRREHGVDGRDRRVTLPDAGHFSRPPATPTTVDRNADLVSGGTSRGNAEGQRTAWDAMLGFLGDVLGAPRTG